MKKWMVKMMMVCSLAAGGFLLTGCSTNTVTVYLVTDDLVVNTTWGSPKARVSFEDYGADYSAFDAKYGIQDSDSVSAIEGKRDEYLAGEEFKDSVEYTVTYPEGKENGDIANGDVITITASYDEEVAKEAHIHVENAVYQYTVSGLEEYEALDLFEGVEVYWEKEQYNINVGITNNESNPILKDMYYQTMEETEDGVVTLRANVSDAQLYEQGYYAKDDVYEKTFDLGKKPDLEFDVSDPEVKEACLQSARDYAEAMMRDCGTVTVDELTGDMTASIVSYELSDPEMPRHGFATIRITLNLSDGTKLTREKTAYVFRLEDGSLDDLEEYSFSSCEVRRNNLVL